MSRSFAFLLVPPLSVAMCLSTVAAAAVAATPVAAPLQARPAQSAQPAQDITAKPNPQHERPGSAGPGQGEMEMEQEMWIDGLTLRWGQTGSVPPGRAHKTRAGRCLVPFRVTVRNTDRAPSLPTDLRVRVQHGDHAPLITLPVPALAPGGRHRVSGEIALPSGETVLLVEVDAMQRMIERDERNNLRRVGLKLGAACASPQRVN